jgi:hypothetical protein
VADLEAHDALHDGAEDDGEESADIEQLEHMAKMPGEGEGEGDREGEEDVAADRRDMVGTIGGGIRVIGLEGQGTPSLMHSGTVVADALTWMQGGASGWLE